MKKIFVFLFFLFFMVMAESRVILNVSLDGCNSKGDFFVKHILQNKTDAPKEFYRPAPVMSGYILDVRYFIYYDENNPKSPVYIVGSGVTDGSTIVIQPGEKIEMIGNLSSIASPLYEINKKYKLYVFWQYDFIAKDNYTSSSSGFFVVPKNCAGK